MLVCIYYLTDILIVQVKDPAEATKVPHRHAGPLSIFQYICSYLICYKVKNVYERIFLIENKYPIKGAGSVCLSNNTEH
jgi:hypothetical protein